MLKPRQPRTVSVDDEFEAWTGTATAEIVDLIGRMFAAQGEHRSTELLRWQYLEHLGGAHVCIAYTKAGLFAEPAALYAAFPTKFQLSGQEVISYQSFDTLTSAAFRGRGLFIRLADLAYQEISEMGASLVYGIPNGDSFGGFTRRLGWTNLDPLPMLIRPIGLRYPLARLGIRRRAPETSASPTTGVGLPTDVTDLYCRSQYAKKAGVIRDFDYLRWRIRRPNNSYRSIESRDQDGRLVGFAIIEILAKHGGSIGYLMELMVDATCSELAEQLTRRAIGIAVDAGADVILAWSMPEDETHQILRRQGFRSLPARISPIELHLGYKPLKAGIVLSRDDLRWSYLDSDTV